MSLFVDAQDTFTQTENKYQITLNKCKKYHLDTIIVFTSKTCPHCSKFGRRKNGKGKVYSISGKKKKYPSVSTIPIELTTGKCPECGCYISYDPYFEGINS